MSDVADQSLAFWAKCGDEACAHCWPAAYYPANLSDFAKIMKRAVCPKCGNERPLVAKQAAGVLNEKPKAAPSSPGLRPVP